MRLGDCGVRVGDCTYRYNLTVAVRLYLPAYTNPAIPAPPLVTHKLLSLLLSALGG